MARFAVVLSLARIVLSQFLLVCFVARLAAQTIPPGGIPPFSTQLGGPFDLVDPASNNILIQLPLRSKIGKIPFSYQLVGNSNANISLNAQNQPTWHVSFGLAGQPLVVDLGVRAGYTLIKFPGNYCNGQGGQIITEDADWVVGDALGGSHPLPTSFAVNLCPGAALPGPAITTDGSGYTVVATSNNPLTYLVYDRSGNAVSPATAANNYSPTVTDPDGIHVTAVLGVGGATTYTDTLGQTALVATILGGPSSDTYTFADASGTNQTFTVGYSQYNVQTNFGCSGVLEWSLPSWYLPTSITTPTGGTYSISYEQTPQYANSYKTVMHPPKLDTKGLGIS